MIQSGLPPKCRHLPDPVPVPRTGDWLSIDAVASRLGLSPEHLRGTWDRLVAETWANGGTLAGGSPARMALCRDRFLDAWCLDARDLPALRRDFRDRETARAEAFMGNRGPAPEGPMSRSWLSFAQVASRMGSSNRNASIQAFWISVTAPQEFDRRQEPYMRGVRLSLREDARTGLELWALRAEDLDRFGDAYLCAMSSHAPRKASVRGAGEISCEEGWALFGREIDWGTYFIAWHHRPGRYKMPAQPTYKTLGGAFAVARIVANVHSGYGKRHTPISILMNHVERDLRPIVRGMLTEFEEAGTLGALGPLREAREVVVTTYVDGVPLPSVTDEFKERFMEEATMRLAAERGMDEDPSPSPAR